MARLKEGQRPGRSSKITATIRVVMLANRGHVHIFETHQSPPSGGCRCFWHEVDVIESDTLPLGLPPIESAGGGGFE
jgi:hypothetical protein